MQKYIVYAFTQHYDEKKTPQKRHFVTTLVNGQRVVFFLVIAVTPVVLACRYE